MKQTRLSNGIMIVTEQLPFFHMAHVQIRFTVGSGVERPEEWGAAHFLEHLTFAGINEKDGLDFTCKMADYGAIYQAKTAMDHTTYQVDVPYGNLIPVLRLFLQLIANPQIDSDRVETERSVILSELGMVEEDLFESSLAKFYEHMLEEQYGHPVIGTEESIKGLNAKSLQRFRDRFYTPDNLLIGIAGNLQHEVVVQEIEQILGEWKGTSDVKCLPILRKSSTHVHVPKESDVVHFLWGFEAPNRKERERAAFAVMMKSLSGDGTDMWSHFFRLIRTKLGMAYAVGGEYLYLNEIGLYFFTVITQQEHAAEVIRIVEQEIARFQRGEIPLEVQRAAVTLTSAVCAEDDQLPSRVTRLLDREIYEQPFKTLEEECALLAQTTEADVLRAAGRYLQPKLLMVLGPDLQVDAEEVVRS